MQLLFNKQISLLQMALKFKELRRANKVSLLKQIDAIPRLTICTNRLLGKLLITKARVSPTDLQNSKVSSGKITHAFSHLILPEIKWIWLIAHFWPESLTNKQTITMCRLRRNSWSKHMSFKTRISAASSNSWLCTKDKVLVRKQMESLDLHLKIAWSTRKRTISGHFSTTGLLQSQFCPLVLHQVIWTINPMPSLVVTTPRRLLEEKVAFKLSRTTLATIRVRLDRGPSTPKTCFTTRHPWSKKNKPRPTQLLLILVARLLLCLLNTMLGFMISGKKESPTLTASLMRPFAKRLVTALTSHKT